MRMLASIALSFAAAVFAAVLLPWSGWTWWAAAAAGALGLLAVFLRRHLPGKLRLRAAVMLFSLCAGLVYYGGYQNLVQRPVLDRCGREAAFSATVENYGQLTERGAKVTVYPEGLRGAKAVCYGDASLAALEPGQRITGRAKWQDAGRIHENDVTTFTSRGVFALLYIQEDAAGQCREPAVASAADGPGHAGEDRRHLGRRDYRRVRNGGADWGSERLVRRGRDRYVPGGPIAPVCGLRAALRFFGEPVGTAAG